MDDSLVRNMLFDLRESCKAWAVKYSNEGGIPGPDVPGMNALTSVLTSPKFTMSSEANILVIGRLQYGSTIILNALLAQFICSQIVQQPFFFLPSIVKEHSTWELKDFFDGLSKLSLSRSTFRPF
jgi:hypothetical protein